MGRGIARPPVRERFRDVHVGLLTAHLNEAEELVEPLLEAEFSEEERRRLFEARRVLRERGRAPIRDAHAVATRALAMVPANRLSLR
jgi:hypothetical protein